MQWVWCVCRRWSARQDAKRWPAWEPMDPQERTRQQWSNGAHRIGSSTLRWRNPIRVAMFVSGDDLAMAGGGWRWVQQLEDGKRSEARIFNLSKITQGRVSPWLGAAVALQRNSGGEEGLQMARRCEENAWESFFRSRKALHSHKSATVQYCRGSTP
jgi:hypothetical protein